MKFGNLFLGIVCSVVMACGQQSTNSKKTSVLVNPEGKEIISRFNVPDGYKRIEPDSGSFAYFLQHFQLKENGAKVYYYNGEEKGNSGVYEAVLDIDVGEKDLQQCADAVMRLRAEYLFSMKQYKKIHFNFS